MNSTPYLIARSDSEYGFTGSTNATLKLSAQPDAGCMAATADAAVSTALAALLLSMRDPL